MAWLGDWAKRVKLTIDHGDIDAEQTWHHLRVHLSASSGHSSRDVSCVFDELESNGNRKKIALTKADGTTQLYCEIEKWDHANEQAELWVSRDGWVWSPDADTDLYLYYDKNHADNIAYIGDKGLAGRDGPRENVWDSPFKTVQHLNDETTSAVTDSTGNNNDGAKKGANEPIEADGKIGKGQDFDGNDDNIEVAHHATLNITGQLTMEAWVKIEGTTTNYQFLLGKYYYHPWSLRMARISQSQGFFIDTWTETGRAYTDITLMIPSLDTWYHVIGVYDLNKVHIYINGGQWHDESAQTGNLLTNEYPFRLGQKSAETDLLNGVLDEVRVSATARTAAWVKASYESERDHLLDFGEEETYVVIVEGAALGSGIGLSEATAYLVIPALASGSGIGLAEALTEAVIFAQAHGSGIGIGSIPRAIRLPLNMIRPPVPYTLGRVKPTPHNLGQSLREYTLGRKRR